jgi:hypothetical protein
MSENPTAIGCGEYKLHPFQDQLFSDTRGAFSSGARRDAPWQTLRIDQRQVRKIREMEYLTAVRWVGTSPDRLQQVAMARGRPAWMQHRLNGEL